MQPGNYGTFPDPDKQKDVAEKQATPKAIVPPPREMPDAEWNTAWSDCLFPKEATSQQEKEKNMIALLKRASSHILNVALMTPNDRCFSVDCWSAIVSNPNCTDHTKWRIIERMPSIFPYDEASREEKSVVVLMDMVHTSKGSSVLMGAVNFIDSVGNDNLARSSLASIAQQWHPMVSPEIRASLNKAINNLSATLPPKKSSALFEALSQEYASRRQALLTLTATAAVSDNFLDMIQPIYQANQHYFKNHPGDSKRNNSALSSCIAKFYQLPFEVIQIAVLDKIASEPALANMAGSVKGAASLEELSTLFARDNKAFTAIQEALSTLTEIHKNAKAVDEQKVLPKRI